MIDINELREIGATMDELNELLDRLEAAEKECNALRTDKATLQQMAYSLKDHLEVAERERDELRARINSEREAIIALCAELDNDENTDDYRKAARWMIDRIRARGKP